MDDKVIFLFVMAALAGLYVFGSVLVLHRRQARRARQREAAVARLSEMTKW